MALTPNGFPENHPSSIKKEMALLESRIAKDGFVQARHSFSQACSFALKSVHSKAGAAYRAIGHKLGL